MAMSPSFASRLVIRIAPALLLSFVFSITPSYATRIHHPPYDDPPMDANCRSIRLPNSFLTLSKTLSMFSIGGHSGRSRPAVTGHGKPIDPHSERTEFIKGVLIDNIDPVVLLLGARPEKTLTNDSDRIDSRILSATMHHEPSAGRNQCPRL